MGRLGDAALASAFGEWVRAMGEEDDEDSLWGWLRSARDFELAARPVD